MTRHGWVRLLLLLGILTTLAVVWQSRQPLDIDEDWVQPPGFWQRAPVGLSPSRSDELARVLSLPYAVTGERATGDSGVVFYDPERAYGTHNLYASGHGPEAHLLDMEGRTVHRWRYSYERAFPGRDPGPETACWRRVVLLPDGSLLALFQGGGLIKLDRRSQLLGALDLGLYNDLDVGPDGTVFALAKEAVLLPEIDRDHPVLEDFVVAISPDFELSRKISLLAALRRSPFAELLEPLPRQADILHSNTVVYLDGRHEAVSSIFLAGRIFFSLREIDLVGVLDLETEQVVWARRGPWNGQHEPQPLDDGHLLLFDNRGGEGGASRVLEIEPESGEIVWSFEHPTFRSGQAGTARRLPNGNTLITSSEQGRAFEITSGGEVVWELVSPHRGGVDNSLVATLWEVVRLDESFDPSVLAPGPAG